MKRRGIMALAAAIACLAWCAMPMEKGEAVELARVLYQHCAQQTDETMRVFGSVIMNRVGRREFGDTLSGVLAKLPSTPVYDERALECAEALCGGARSFDAAPAEVVYAVHRNEDQSAYAQMDLWRLCGDYVFYYGS